MKPRHTTAESQTVSLHYVHAYAVKDTGLIHSLLTLTEDRVDYSCFRYQRSGDINLYDILPNKITSDLKENFTVHVYRVITELCLSVCITEDKRYFATLLDGDYMSVA